MPPSTDLDRCLDHPIRLQLNHARRRHASTFASTPSFKRESGSQTTLPYEEGSRQASLVPSSFMWCACVCVVWVTCAPKGMCMRRYNLTYLALHTCNTYKPKHQTTIRITLVAGCEGKAYWVHGQEGEGDKDSGSVTLAGFRRSDVRLSALLRKDGRGRTFSTLP